MKIALRGSGSRRLVRKLEKTGAIDLVGGSHHDLFFDSHWPNPKLEEFLRLAARHGSFDLNPWMTFMKGEIRQAGFLQPRRRKTVQDSNPAYERMRDEYVELPWIGDDPMRRYRMPEHVYLSKVRLKPNQIAGVGEWTDEYIVPSEIRSVFEREKLAGVEYRSIAYPRKNQILEGYWHLYTGNVLGHRELDIASPRIDSSLPEEQAYECMGCLCYAPAVLDSAQDFNRTGEKMVGFQFPGWVVRSRVREVFEKHALKGWAFEPVLELGTPIYDEYTDLWSSFQKLLRDCQKHTVRNQSF